MTARICNVEEHLSCGFYTENSPEPLIKTIELLEGQTLQHRSDKYEAVLLTSGSITLSREGSPEVNISKKKLFLLYPGDIVNLHGLEPAYLIVCRLGEDIQYCHNIEVSDLKEFDLPEQHQLCVLPFKQPIDMFAETLVACVKSGLLCETYLTCKFTELMTLLRVYYTKYEIASFFRPLIHKFTEFQTKILSIEGEVKTAKEMAMKCHMTEVGFRKKFKQEMGMLPKEYLIKRKKRLISKDLRNGVKNNNQLCEEYGFSSASSFNNFCRTYLDGKPSDLRKLKC